MKHDSSSREKIRATQSCNVEQFTFNGSTILLNKIILYLCSFAFLLWDLSLTQREMTDQVFEHEFVALFHRNSLLFLAVVSFLFRQHEANTFHLCKPKCRLSGSVWRAYWLITYSLAIGSEQRPLIEILNYKLRNQCCHMHTLAACTRNAHELLNDGRVYSSIKMQ